MDFKLSTTQGPWKIMGTDGHTKISVSPPTSIKIEVGEGEARVSCIVPIQVAVALQTQEAIEFIQSPLIAPFFWAKSERAPRTQAANGLANIDLGRERRAYVALIQQIEPGIALGEAWDIARLKYPSNSDRKLESLRLFETARLIRKDPTMTRSQAMARARLKHK